MSGLIIAVFQNAFGNALFSEYDRSPPPRRKIIAEILGKPDFDLNKGGAELRKLVEGK